MIIRVVPTRTSFGASIEGLDLSRPLSNETFKQLLHALGHHGVISFPRQSLTALQLREFSSNFGRLEVNVAGAYQEPGIPEVMVLSNIVENGRPIGLADAGQDWHTDMSYNRMIAFTNVLYGMVIPTRDGRSLGNTEFCNMHGAYDQLPEQWKTRLDGMTVLHDFDKFWEMMRRERGSTRPPLTVEQRAARPPVVHPLFMRHPITGKRVLYANPGYSVRILEMSEKESDEALKFLFSHQVRPEFRYAHEWKPGDVLMWDNMGTIHNAVADYRPDEARLIKRCQVMATRFFLSDGTPRDEPEMELAAA